MSIKSEIRLIDQVVVPVTNNKFLKGTEGWKGSGTTTWKQSGYNNAIRKISGNTTRLSQELSLSGGSVSLTYFPGSQPVKVSYSIFGDNNTGTTFTPYLGGVSGTTRNENGTYYDIFYVGEGNLLTINETDYYKINGNSIVDADNQDYLIWG